MQDRISPSKRIFLFLILLGILTFFLSMGFLLFATEKDENKKQFTASQSSLQPEGTLMNINNFSMWIYADGTSAVAPSRSDAGTIYPRGTANVVFQDGVVWGGQVRDGQEPRIRVGGQKYSSGTVPGLIISKGVAEDFNDPSVNRIWRIHRDYFYAYLRQDAAELFEKPEEDVTFEDEKAVRALYERDWQEWPWKQGAPFYDADGDGVYTPQFYSDGSPKVFPEADEPGIANADKVVWLVFNDLDSTTTLSFSGSPPIGIEMQATLWGYRRVDALGNIIFKRYRLIYKGTEESLGNARIDNMYISQFADPDLGYLGDDFVGCDTLLNLGFTYNYSTQDREFEKFNLPPPAVGYDFLAGPVVPDPLSEAIINLKKRLGFRNLPMTTFAGEVAISSQYPGQGQDYNWTLQWWNLLRGFRPRPVSPPDPWTDPWGEITKFRFPGDPVTELGWIDNNPGERRIFMASGPFNMALGDTNEITIGLVGGLGSDRLMSITVMKYYDRIAQEAFDNLLELPKPPPTPVLTATEFDGQILLNWGEDQENVESVEQWQENGHQFEGYNIYQLPSASTRMDEGIKLTTYDLTNEVTTMIQEQFDPQSSAIITVPVQIGTNSGLVRTKLIERDELRNQPLINGQEYHFAVTSYSFNADRNATVKSLESIPAVMSVTPHSLNPGVRLGAAVGDTLPVEHTRGKSEGKVVSIVIDPTKLSGDSYNVVFEGERGPDQVWHLVNTTTGRTVLKEQNNQSGDDDYLTVEGVIVKVINVPANFAGPGEGDGIVEVAYGGEVVDQPDVVWHDPNSNGTYYISAGGGGGVLSRLIPFIDLAIPDDFELRFTEAGGWGVYAFENDIIATVPFELWRIGSATPDDSTDDVRMIPFLLSWVDTAPEWGWATGTDQALGYPASDWVYFVDPEDPTPGSASYDNFAAVCESVGAGGTYPFETDGSRDGYWADFHGFGYVIGRVIICEVDGDGHPPPAGTTIRFITSKPNTPDDVFTFSTADFVPTFSEERAHQDVEAINVFPNPYYGLFRLDRSASNRFITFSHFPQKAIIRIFTIAGALVRTLQKDDASQFLRWDLLNEHGRLVGAGIYIAHIDMPELSVTKILKLALIHE